MNDCIHILVSDHCAIFPVDCKDPKGKGCYLPITERGIFLDLMRKKEV